MNILLIGALGRMGQEVCSYVKNGNDKIVAGIDIEDNLQSFPIYKNVDNVKENFDVIIDFSTSKNRKEYFQLAKKRMCPYGLFSSDIQLEDEKLFKNLAKFVPVLQCKNASLGMNVLYQVLKNLSPLLNHSDVVLTEYHHKEKIDVPSGTAKDILSILEKNNIFPQLSACRVGNEKGFHKIEFFLDNEILEISHRVNSRQIFASGAVSAMHKLMTKQSGFYTDILDL